MAQFYQKESETAPVEKIRELQSARLINQVRNLWENVEYYRVLLEKKGVCPDDIKSVNDLHKLPFLTKEDLRKAYPYGFMARPISECVRVHSTSGTTGKRIIAFYTQHDIDIWEDCCARAIVAAGGTKDDVCQISVGYGLFTGGLGHHGGAHRVGCLTLPMSTGNTERQIQFMQDLKTTILCATPSYAAYIGETLKEMGYTPDDLPLKTGIFGAEAWTEEMRFDIEKSLGIKAYDIYGLTELGGPGVAFECEEQSGMHINEDYYIAEIIDPDTGELLPEGSRGELVLTALDKEAFPLVRYRTHDICILKRDKCPCGRTFIKMSKPLGRSDDMLTIKGVNVFPSQIEAVLLEQGYAPNYRIEVDRINNVDTLDVFVELDSDNVKDIHEKEKKLAASAKSMLGITPRMHLVSPKTLARSEGKAVRVIDKRRLWS